MPRERRRLPAGRVVRGDMTQRVEVVASARLHMGFFDLGGGPGRRFGSIGLALDSPVTRVVLGRAEATRVTGCEAARAARSLAAIRRALALPDGHALSVQSAIPAHAGLGSGTQLALAIAAAARRLHGLPAAPRDDAQFLDRGGRSGIGLELFAQGGLVVDGGRGALDAPPPLLARLAVPQDWRILLLLDRAGHGLSGAPENAAFATLPPMPPAVSGEICRAVLMRALPGLAERDLPAFGAAITLIQQHVGDHFAPAQGARFTSRRVAAALEALAGLGAHGLGQSSWGPTGFAFANSPAEAARLAAELAALPQARGLDISICRALNRGAAVVAC